LISNDKTKLLIPVHNYKTDDRVIFVLSKHRRPSNFNQGPGYTSTYFTRDVFWTGEQKYFSRLPKN